MIYGFQRSAGEPHPEYGVILLKILYGDNFKAQDYLPFLIIKLTLRIINMKMWMLVRRSVKMTEIALLSQLIRTKEICLPIINILSLAKRMNGYPLK